jgi:hypothetical protein
MHWRVPFILKRLSYIPSIVVNYSQNDGKFLVADILLRLQLLGGMV